MAFITGESHFISGLTRLYLNDCQNLDFLVSFSRYEFKNLRELNVSFCDGNIIESHILTRPESFPSLMYLGLRVSSIVTIPRSISRFTRLRDLDLSLCEELREISRLPPSIRHVNAINYMFLDLPSSCRLLNQFGKIFMDPYFCEESESESELYHGGCKLVLPRIPKELKLNHQSDGNSVSFWVGHEFQKLVLCFAFQSELLENMEATCFVVSTNGFSIEKEIIFLEGLVGPEHLCLSPIDLWEWEELNPSEKNLLTIEVKIKYSEKFPSDDYDDPKIKRLEVPSSSDDPKITWLGVHVDCICCGCGSSSVSDDIDHHSFPSDVGMDTNLLVVPPGLDDLGSSPRAWICDDTELQPLPAVFSTSYGSDLDHGVLNNGGASELLIEPNSGLAGSYLGFEGFESTFHGDVHDLDSSSFASIGYNDSDVGRTLAPLVPEGTTIHHSLSVLPVNTTNGSELGLGWLGLGFSDGFDPGSSSMAHAFDNNDSNFNLFPPSKKTRTS